MILKREIEKIAEQKRVPKTTIDKDWVLGHFIDAIYSIPECRNDLILKGGTCLKKCRYPDYRFSEDLDFTSVNPDFVLDSKLLNKITRLVTERTNIPLFIKGLKELKFDGKKTGYATIIKFWGADHPKNQAPPPPARWTTSIKIEIILYEEMLFLPDEMHKQKNKTIEIIVGKAIPYETFDKRYNYNIWSLKVKKYVYVMGKGYTEPFDPDKF